MPSDRVRDVSPPNRTEVTPAPPHLGEVVPALRARCWGTRGSLPSPGRGTVIYGGNTSCLEVRGRSGATLIFDAGSGIRALGEELRRGAAVSADLFLTHFHWDHIQGLPFFGPIYDATSSIRIHGARQGHADVQSLVAGQMGPMYFPVPFDALAARLDFFHVNGESFERGGVTVSSFRVRHPNNTYGYRIDTEGASVAYVPDNELSGGNYPLDVGWSKSLRAFLDGADVLYHDTMFTDAEYGRFEGWGHSSVSQAIHLAEEAGVGRLCLFHHAPARTDAELERILLEARDDLARRGSALELCIAREGGEIVVEGTQ